MTSDPLLVEVTRGDLVESRHHGSLVLLDGAGVEVLVGPDEPVYARSSLKPLQTVAMLRSGWVPQDEAAVALASASHEGEAGHRDGVRRILAAAGLDESALRCPADLPRPQPELLDYLAAGGQPATVCHNCSGKHAAMVATCAAAGWDVVSYLDPGHPLQRAVVATVADAGGAAVVASSVDGCGAPAHALPPAALARGFARLATATAGTPEARVAAAVSAHPWLLGGTGRAVTELIGEVPGLVAKDGAEGVWAAALPDGRAMAAKLADGGARALPAVLAAVLQHWGHDGPAVRRWAAAPVLGGGRPVGVVRPSTELRDALGIPLLS